MPGRTWDNEISYRRRLLAIIPVVVVLLGALLWATRRMAPVDIFKFVGWRGELELMPEITIIPDVPAPESSPAETGKTAEEPVLLDLADAPGEFEANPPRVQNEPSPQVSPAFDDISQVPSEKKPEREAVSYSDKYVILRMVKPEYPPEELAQGIEGNVTVELLVDERGRVSTASVISALGPRSFQDAALEAALQFEFQPPTDERGARRARGPAAPRARAPCVSRRLRATRHPGRRARPRARSRHRPGLLAPRASRSNPPPTPGSLPRRPRWRASP
jgi:TonB family protein